MEKHENTRMQTRIEKMFEIVEFPSQGTTLRGRLYNPNKTKKTQL